MADVFCAYDEMVDATALIENPRNPNTHPDQQIQMLGKIIADQGWRAPITVSNRSGFVIRGHGRLQAARKMGFDQVPVDYQDYADEAAEWADMIADNRIAELAEIDSTTLKDLLEEMDTGDIDMDLTGFSSDVLEDMMAPEFDPDDCSDEDDAPEAPMEAKTEVGRIYQLGDHRLMCGDSTSQDEVSRLMDGDIADICVTDPPYNVDYHGGSGETIKNDNMGDSEFYDFLLAAFRNAFSAMSEGAPLYVAHADSEGYNFRGAFQDSGFLLKQCIIWVKNSMVLGRQDYQWQHEPVLYGWKPGAAHRWYGNFDKKTVIDDDVDLKKLSKADLIKTVNEVRNLLNGSVVRQNKPHANDAHPTMKPVALIRHFVINSSKQGDICLELFGGSGSTMMACEQTNRKCYAMELDPRYCDVIVERYAKQVGADADKIFELGYHKSDQ